jgi:hypothetical protein
MYFVTRHKDNAIYKSIEASDLSSTTNNTLLKDELITLEKVKKVINLRRIAYWDTEKEKHHGLSPVTLNGNQKK